MPSAEGTAFELSPVLQPLAPFRDRLLVLSGLANREADAKPGEGAGESCAATNTEENNNATRQKSQRAGGFMPQA